MDILYSVHLFLTDIDECVSQPCLNGGLCIEGVNQYFCFCQNRFTGNNCEIGKVELC